MMRLTTEVWACGVRLLNDDFALSLASKTAYGQKGAEAREAQ